MHLILFKNVALAYRICWTGENKINAYNLQSKQTVV